MCNEIYEDVYYTTKTAHFTVIDKGIVKAVLNNKAQVNETDALDNFVFANNLVAEGTYCLLLDERDSKSESHDARLFQSSRVVAKQCVATAILVDSYFKRLTLTMQINRMKPVSLMRVFTDEQEAISWLQQTRENFFFKGLID